MQRSTGMAVAGQMSEGDAAAVTAMLELHGDTRRCDTWPHPPQRRPVVTVLVLYPLKLNPAPPPVIGSPGTGPP